MPPKERGRNEKCASEVRSTAWPSLWWAGTIPAGGFCLSFPPNAQTRALLWLVTRVPLDGAGKNSKD